MSTTAKLKLADATAAPERTPAREALAKAIVKRNEAAARVEAIESARRTAQQNVFVAQTALEDAQQNVETAKANAAKHLTDTALGKTTAAPLSIRAARNIVQDAEDQLDAAVAARAALSDDNPEIKSAQSSLDIAELHVSEAIRAVVASDPVTAKMLHRARKVQRELAEYSEVLYCLGSTRGGLPNDEYFTREPAFHDLTLMKRWDAAMKAMQNDPDVRLPELPA